MHLSRANQRFVIDDIDINTFNIHNIETQARAAFG